MRFTRLKLQNWRNFKQVDVPLEQRVFIFGANAAGKSNLLDAFRFLRDVAEEQGGLRRAVDDIRRGLKHIRTLHATRSTDVTIEVLVELDPDEPEWRYSLTLTGDSKNRVVVKSERVEHGDTILLARPDEDDERDPARLSQTHLEQVSANQSFRRLAEFLASVEYIHLVPQLVRDGAAPRISPHDPFGTGFLEDIARTPTRQREARLRRIQRALGAALPQFAELRLERDEVGKPHLEARYQHWRAKGAWQREDQFSDGTLRLIGLLWVLDGTAPLLLEEPEISLHATVVQQIPRMLVTAMRRGAGRQVLLSTHSEQLMADTTIEPSEVLILEPTPQETRISLASEDPDICAVAEAGQSIAELLVARTRPANIEQVSLARA